MSTTTMPRSVKTFAALYYAVAALQLANLVRGLATTYPEVGTRSRAALDSAWGQTFLLVVFSLVVVIPALMTWLAASRRQNWARIVLVVMFAHGTWFELTPVATNVFSKLDLNTARFLVITASQAVGLCLAFSPAANGWFSPADTRAVQA